MKKGRADLLAIYQAALRRVSGEQAVARALEQEPMQGECALLAVGKAAQAMAKGACSRLDDKVRQGLVISRPDHFDHHWLQERGFSAVEGSHPVPDQKSLDAADAMLRFIGELPAGLPLLLLISGGASSLVELPRPGIDLETLQKVNRWLLGSGLDILAINAVRRALSQIKGGGLLEYLGDRPLRLMLISDVPGDEPAAIGSGLLVPADDVAARLAGLRLPDWLQDLLPENIEPVTAPAPRPELVATLRDAREAAAEKARELGYNVRLNHAFIGGDAANCGRRMALELADDWPGVTIWGGEPTVELPPEPGRGGRNQHLALSVAQVIDGRYDLLFLGAGTDGSDGNSDDAGALVDGWSLRRARNEGWDDAQALAAADSGSLLEASGDLLHTGPTGTNVMDLMIGMKLAGRVMQ